MIFLRLWRHYLGCYIGLHTWRDWRDAGGPMYQRCLCCDKSRPLP